LNVRSGNFRVVGAPADAEGTITARNSPSAVVQATVTALAASSQSVRMVCAANCASKASAVGNSETSDAWMA
jgi:hypothetical protein